MSTGLIALLIVFVVIIGAVLTKRCIEFLLLGSLLGSIVLFKAEFLSGWTGVLSEVCGEADNVWLVLVCGLFGSLIALLQESKGTFGFAKLINKICNSERKTVVTSFILGVLIFIDDYLNVLTVGVCMKNVYDKKKIPRETLAYMLDSTGAPVCVLLPVSTWAVFFSGLFYDTEPVQALGYSSMGAYMHAVPFAFYPLFALLIVFLFSMGWFPKLGTMKKAYERVAQTGKVYSDISRKYNQSEETGIEQTGNIWNFLIPMGVLIAVAIVSNDLLTAIVVALLVSFVMYVPRGIISFEDFMNIVFKGFCDMIPTLAMVLIALCLANTSSQLGMTEYIIDCVRPLLQGAWYPAIAFLLVSVLAFVTGSNWGMSAVCIPILLPLGAAVGANTILVMAAVLSGGTFGSHACFYTDATLLSSQAAGIDNMEHALSQLPYVLIAAGMSFVGFLVCGFVM